MTRVSFRKKRPSGQTNDVAYATLYSSLHNMLNTLAEDYSKEVSKVLADFEQKENFDTEFFRVDFFRKQPSGQFFLVDPHEKGMDDTTEKFKLLAIREATEPHGEGNDIFTLICDIE